MCKIGQGVEWEGYLQILKIIRLELIPVLLISYLANFPQKLFCVFEHWASQL